MTAAADIFLRLADGEVIVIDGGTGTELQAMGVPMDGTAWSGKANLGQGAQIIGGCCGIRPDHIKALADGLPRRAG
jgi:S-methylmethionine-dependent homocysteine/selenocysteine methylase